MPITRPFPSSPSRPRKLRKVTSPGPRAPVTAPRDDYATRSRGAGPMSPAPAVKPVGIGSVLTLRAGLLGSSTASSIDTLCHQVAAELEDRARALEGHAGGGFEHFGSGDPEVVRRRALVAQLLSLPTGYTASALTEPWAQSDAQTIRRIDGTDDSRTMPVIIEEAIRTLKAAGATAGAQAVERRNEGTSPLSLKQLCGLVWTYSTRPGADKGLLQSYYYQLILEERMQRNAKVNTSLADTAAEALVDGSQRFFEVDHARFSTQVLSKISDPELRARTLVDILLQFREPIDHNTEVVKDTAGGAGVQSVLEMRSYIRGLDCNSAEPTQQREYALARAVALANPFASSNAILEARHLVGKIRRMSWQLVYGEDAVQDGFRSNPYEAIHHNFSVETPKLIAAFTGDTVFGGGDPRTFCRLSDALTALKAESTTAEATLEAALAADGEIRGAFDAWSSARGSESLADRLESFLVSRCRGVLDSKSPTDGTLSAAERKHLKTGDVSAVEGEYPEKLATVARLFRTVCEALPSDRTLADHLFSARGAVPQVAEVIQHLRSPEAPRLATLASINRARAALKHALDVQPLGADRIEILRLDKQLEALTSGQLGGSVVSVGDVSTDPQRVEALGALWQALEGAVLSGMDALYDFADPMAGGGPTLQAVANRIGAQFEAGAVDLATYQATVVQAYEAVVKATERIRHYVDQRVPEVGEGKLVPNPAFLDDLIKEGPLHYARAIAQKALRVGASSAMTESRIVNPKDVTVLNPLGRVVFDRVLIAPTMADLEELRPGRADMCWVTHMDEKKMIAVGGIMSDFPGGYCHAAVYARGAGIAALSNPAISPQWTAFADGLIDDKLYYDDSGGQITMMPLSDALSEGLIAEGEAERLRPGSNRQIEYLDWSEADEAYDRIATHHVEVHVSRPTTTIQLYGTSSPIHGKGTKVLTFDELGEMGTAARALVGEKSLVLGLMSADPALKKLVPPGSAISTLRVQKLLGDAGVLESWLALWERDPSVGKITDANFLESKFYTDGSYRTEARERMSAMVRGSVADHLIGADGEPTAAGRALIDELKGNKALAACDNWIVRSSFTAEDRPGKSGAGQYDSFPNCRTDLEVLRGVIGVIASAWEYAPVENNVAEEYNLAHIWPAITVMKCLNADKSGVAISRDTDNGHRLTVSYQAVEGFGGGVESGQTQEGRIRHNGAHDLVTRADAPALVTKELSTALLEAVMKVERLFHQKVEPGRGLPVDIEWVVEGGELKLVQARTVRV